MRFRASDTMVRQLAFSPDSQLIATAGNEPTVKLWEAATGRTRTTLSGHANYGNWSVASVAFSPDGRSLVSGGGNGSILLWDVATGKDRAYLGHDYLRALAYAPDGKTLAHTDYKTVKLRNLATGQERTVRGEHASFVRTLAFFFETADSWPAAAAGTVGPPRRSSSGTWPAAKNGPISPARPRKSSRWPSRLMAVPSRPPRGDVR